MEGKAYKPRQPFHVELVFEDAAEAFTLAQELQSWTPTGGWSETAQYLFQLLEEGYNGTPD